MRKLIIVFVLTCLTTFAFGAIPATVNFQGKLTDAGGVAVTGTRDIVFRIYDGSGGGATLMWTEAHTSGVGSPVSVFKGLFDVVLGSLNPLTLPFDEPYFVELEVEGEILAPRVPFASVPYAMMAGGSEATEYSDSTGAVAWVDISGIPPGFADGIDDVDDADNVVGNEVVTNLVFNSGTGNLVLSQNAGTADYTVNLDGRYLQTEVDGDVSNELITDFSYNSTTGVLSITEGGFYREVYVDIFEDDLSDNLLNDLLDTDVPTPGDGQVLTWDAGSGTWIAADDDIGIVSWDTLSVYYTTVELGTSGGSAVHWDNITDVPAGLADGDDWGSQVAVTSAPVTGDGTAGDPITMAPANGTTDGYITSTDWTTFNDHVTNDADMDDANELNVNLTWNETDNELTISDPGGDITVEITGFGESSDVDEDLTNGAGIATLTYNGDTPEAVAIDNTWFGGDATVATDGTVEITDDAVQSSDIDWGPGADQVNAGEVPYDNGTSGLTATDVQAAIDEIDGEVDGLTAATHTLQDAYDDGNTIDVAATTPVQITATGSGNRALDVTAGAERALQVVNSGADEALYARNDGSGPAIYSSGDIRLSGSAGTKIYSAADLMLQLDEGGSASSTNTLHVVDDAEADVFTIDEDGNVVTTGDYHVGAIGLSDVGTDAVTSGAYLSGYYNGTSGLTADDVQEAIDELDSNIDDITSTIADDFIQNQSTAAQTADFWVDGNGMVEGDLTVGNIVGQTSDSYSLPSAVNINSSSASVVLATMSFTAGDADSKVHLAFSGTMDDRNGNGGAYVRIELVRNPGAGETVLATNYISLFSRTVYQVQTFSITGVDIPPTGAHDYVVRAIVERDPYTAGRCTSGVMRLAEIKE